MINLCKDKAPDVKIDFVHGEHDVIVNRHFICQLVINNPLTAGAAYIRVLIFY